MTSDDTLNNDELRALEHEVRVLRERLRQREAALTILNRRLVSLERFDEAAAGTAPAATTIEAEVRAVAAEEELDRLRNTRTFRWTAAPRTVYRSLRRGM
jgi:hypothetical protein